LGTAGNLHFYWKISRLAARARHQCNLSSARIGQSLHHFSKRIHLVASNFSTSAPICAEVIKFYTLVDQSFRFSISSIKAIQVFLIQTIFVDFIDRINY
jgi:hypothetical protein